jgi:hypothetical protein
VGAEVEAVRAKLLDMPETLADRIYQVAILGGPHHQRKVLAPSYERKA